MILLAETPVKYRDGTVKTLDELGGEVSELAPDTPVKSGSTSKPLDEFIQDQIVLTPETSVVDGEDTMTLDEFVEDSIVLAPDTPVVDGSDTTTLEGFVEAHGGGGGSSVSVTGDGSKTYKDCLNELYSRTSGGLETSIDAKIVLEPNNFHYILDFTCKDLDGDVYYFSAISGSTIHLVSLSEEGDSSYLYRNLLSPSMYTDLSNSVFPSGGKMSIYW